MKRTHLLESPAVLLVGFLCTVSFPVFSQQQSTKNKPSIVVTALTAPEGDAVAASLASTITSSLDLMLRLSGSVELHRADFLSPTTSLDRTIPYYDSHQADEAVYGSVKPSGNGAYVVTFDVWSSSHPRAHPAIVTRTISNPLSSFEIADQLSLNVASTVVGRKLTMGTLVIENVAHLSKFSVYVGGQLLGSNRTRFEVLTGKRTVIVAKPGILGAVPIQTFHVQIRARSTTAVSLSPKIPPRRRGKGSSKSPEVTAAAGAPSSASFTAHVPPVLPPLTIRGSTLYYKGYPYPVNDKLGFKNLSLELLDYQGISKDLYGVVNADLKRIGREKRWVRRGAIAAVLGTAVSSISLAVRYQPSVKPTPTLAAAEIAGALTAVGGAITAWVAASTESRSIRALVADWNSHRRAN